MIINVSLNLFIEAEPVNAAWIMEVNYEFPCGTCNVALKSSINGAPPTLGAWQQFTFNLNDLLELGLELSHVDTPFLFFLLGGVKMVPYSRLTTFF